MVERDLVSEAQLQEALEKQKEVLKPIGEILVEMEIIEEARLAHALAEALQLFIDHELVDDCVAWPIRICDHG